MKTWFWRFVCGRRGHAERQMIFETADAHVVVKGCACGKVSEVKPYEGQFPRMK